MNGKMNIEEVAKKIAQELLKESYIVKSYVTGVTAVIRRILEGEGQTRR